MFSVCLEREGRRIPRFIGYHRVQHCTGKSPITSDKCINSGSPIPGVVCLSRHFKPQLPIARKDLDDSHGNQTFFECPMLSFTFTLAQEILQVQCVDAYQNSTHPSSKNLVSSDSWINGALIRYEACLANFSQKCI